MSLICRIEAVENFASRHQHGDRSEHEEQLAAQAGKAIHIVHATLHRAHRQTIDDQKRFKLGLDSEQAADTVNHER